MFAGRWAAKLKLNIAESWLLICWVEKEAEKMLSIVEFNLKFKRVFRSCYSIFFFFSFLFYSQKCFLELKKKSIKCVRRRELYFHFHSLTLHFPKKKKLPKRHFEFGKEMKIREPSPSPCVPSLRHSHSRAPFERLKFLSRWSDAAENITESRSSSSKTWNESVSLTEWDLNVFSSMEEWIKF